MKPFHTLVPTLILGILTVGAAWGDPPEIPQDEKPEAEHPGDEGSEGAETPEDEPEDELRTVNLIIQGEEPDRWNLDLGGGWSEDDGVYGRVRALHQQSVGRR